MSISDHLTAEDKEKMIVPIIIESIKDEEDDERRFVGIMLIDELAHSLGM